MREKDRDIWDDAVRSKLSDFEGDVTSDDWEAIVGRLPEKAPIPLRRTFSYWVAAAVISLLMVMGGIYLYDNQPEDLPIAQEIPVSPRINEPVAEPMKVAEKKEEAPALLAVAKQPVQKKARKTVPVRAAFVREEQPEQAIAVAEVREEAAPEQAETPQTRASDRETQQARVSTDTPVQPQSVHRKRAAQASDRKWSFGMGGGSFSAGSDNFLPQYVTNSGMLRSENLMALNAFNTQKHDLEKTNVHHKTPIGFGLSISRSLNDRFSIQTGLTYSYLRSEWSTNNTYHVDNDQRLHFIGLPVSLAFKIAEWNRFRFYVSAGAKTEVNVAGKQQVKLYSDDVKIMSSSEHIRMKEWLWSVNARAGVSYPIVRFLSAFGEVGTSYYFDNGSEIETIHSEKPFNVSLQFGFRFGF